METKCNGIKKNTLMAEKKTYRSYETLRGIFDTVKMLGNYY